MKKLLILAVGLLLGLSSCGGGNVPDNGGSGYSSGSGQCYVNGYTKKNGTRVSGYYRKC